MSWVKCSLSLHLFKCIVTQNIYIKKKLGGKKKPYGRCLEPLVTHLWGKWGSCSSVGEAVLFVFIQKLFKCP